MAAEQFGKKLLMTASVYAHIRNFHLPYLREFQCLGWETHVGCAGIPDEAPYINQAIELPFRKKILSPSNFQAAHILRRLIRTEQYDLIITHTSLAAFFTRIACKGMKRRPKIVNVMHGYLFDDDTPFFKRQMLLNAERLTAPETDLLLVMNKWDYELAKKHHLGKRIEKAPGMGVDFSKLDLSTREEGRQLRKELGISSSAFVMIYPAEFSERKSQHILIDVMTNLPEEVVLLLPGNGDLLDDCKKKAKDCGLDRRVVFPGQISNMGVWYRAADLAVTASRSEGLPFNVMEAMYMGLPIVASAVKGHTDLIENGVTGFLYPYGDAGQCATCIKQIIEDGELRDTLSRNAVDASSKYAQNIVLPDVMERYLTTG